MTTMTDSESNAHKGELKPRPAVQQRRNLKMIRRGSLQSALDLAVCRALEAHAQELGSRRSEAIRERAQREFMRLVRSNVRNVRGMSKSEFLTQLEESRDRILLERNKAVDELSKLSVRADAFRKLKEADERARKRSGAASASLHDQELEAGLARLFELAAKGELSSEALRDEIMALAARTARSDRERVSGRRTEEYEREVDVFQRRIAKLNSSLSESESALRDLARAKNVDPGLSSVFRKAQGLADDESQLQLKRELLLEIFEANRTLRKNVISTA